MSNTSINSSDDEADVLLQQHSHDHDNATAAAAGISSRGGVGRLSSKSKKQTNNNHSANSAATAKIPTTDGRGNGHEAVSLFARSAKENVKERARHKKRPQAAMTMMGSGSSNYKNNESSRHTTKSPAQKKPKVEASSTSTSTTPTIRANPKPVLKPGTRVYAQFQSNQQYYWGWVYGAKDSIKATGKRKYKVYFEDGDTDDGIPSKRVFTEDECRQEHNQKLQIHITKERSMPDALKNILGLPLSTTTFTTEGDGDGDGEDNTAEHDVSTSVKVNARRSSRRPPVKGRNTNVNGGSGSTGTSDSDKSKKPSQSHNKNKAATQSQGQIHNKFLFDLQKRVVGDGDGKEKDGNKALQQTQFKSLPLQDLYKYRCGTCVLCCAPDCGKCHACRVNHRMMKLNSNSIDGRKLPSHSVCVRNMCCRLPRHCKRQNVTHVLFPTAITPSWYYVYEAVTPSDHLFVSLELKKEQAQEQSTHQEPTTTSTTTTSTWPKSHLLLMNQRGRTFRGGLDVLLRMFPEGAYGLTEDDMEQNHTTKFREFYRLIGE
jgi:hypothetical protein